MKRERGMVKETPLSPPGSQSRPAPLPLAQVWAEMGASLAKTPWLVQSLLRPGSPMAARLAAQYLRLRRLPRRVRRLLGRRGALSLTGAALLLALAGAEPGWAGTTISVSNGSALATAITLANGQTGVYAGTNTLTLTTNIAVESALDAVTSTIVIVGNNHQIVGSAGLSTSIFTVASGGNLTLQDTVVTGGKGSKGGAIYNSGTLTLTNSYLSGNAVSHYGGALFNNAGTVILTSTTVSHNSAEIVGGGIYNAGGSVTLSRSTVSDNSADYGGGLGMGNSGTLVVMDSSVVSNNSAEFEGGGLLNNGGSVTVTNSTVSGNHGHYYGGGILIIAGAVTVNGGSTVSDNQARQGGGIFIKKEATAVVQNSTISGNVASDGGGGISVHYGTAKESCGPYGGGLPLLRPSLWWHAYNDL